MLYLYTRDIGYHQRRPKLTYICHSDSRTHPLRQRIVAAQRNRDSPWFGGGVAQVVSSHCEVHAYLSSNTCTDWNRPVLRRKIIPRRFRLWMFLFATFFAESFYRPPIMQTQWLLEMFADKVCFANDCVPSGNKPSPVPMFTKLYVTTWRQ